MGDVVPRAMRPWVTRNQYRLIFSVLAFFVSLLVTLSTRFNQPLVLHLGASIGFFFIWAVFRWPSIAGSIILVLLPVQTVVFAWVYAQGFDAGFFRPLAALKEMAILGLLIRAERDRRRLERPFDALDKVALAYIGLAIVYLFAGRFLVELPGVSGSARLAGFREDVLFVVLLFAARNISWPALELRRLLRWFVVGIGVAGSFALWHQFREDGFTTWLIDDAQIVDYLRDSLRLDAAAIERTLHHFREEQVRLMGAFISPIALADYLMIPFGLLIAATVRSRVGLVGLALIGLTGYLVLETETRAAILAMGAMVAVVLLIRRAADPDRRVTAAVVGGLVAIVLVPVLLAPIVLGKDTAQESNQGHIEEWTRSLSDLVSRPQGGGLGSATQAVRFAGVDKSNGNAYLLIGNELGVVGMVLFLAILVLTGRALLRRLREDPDPPSWVIGAVIIGVGTAVLGLTQHALENLSVSWAVWLLLGLASAHDAVEPTARGAELRVPGRSQRVPG